jgi:GNAT superfamily N-acetyltransferase
MAADIRQARADDANGIRACYLEGSGRALDLNRLAGYISEYPSAVAMEDDQTAGFAFCMHFAPDIIQLGNLFVADRYRSQGIGAALVRAVESQAASRFDSVIVVNSMLYEGVPNKRPATDFYLKLGYSVLLSTGPTNIFGKRFQQ